MNRNEVEWGPVGEAIYNRTYSRQKADGTYEQWIDTVDRVVRGSTEVGLINDGEPERLMELIYDFKMLPAGRHLWITGTGLPYTRNCFRAPWTERLGDHFEFMADQLLTGGGVGANYSQEYISLSPTLKHFDLFLTCSDEHSEYEQVKAAAGVHFIDTWVVHDQSLKATHVPDSREGWAAGWGELCDAATTSQAYVCLDVSAVRPHGAPIKTFGGTASGPEPFVKSIVNFYGELSNADGRHLTSVEAMQCDHRIAEAVVAGGARRSARMSIVHWRDSQIMEFISCKANHVDHWTTNISVEIDDEFTKALHRNDHHARKVLKAVVAGMWANGEPGLTNTSKASIGESGDVRSTNPCGEIFLEEGESCNIGSVDLAAFGSDDAEAEEAFRLMARFLIRATLVEPYQAITAEVEKRNRRIGVGFLGLQGWAAAHGVKYSDIAYSPVLYDKLCRFRHAIRAEADAYCRELGIASCIKVTAIAPNGTISKLRGTQPGLHSIMARHFWQRVRYTTGDPRIDDARATGLLVEPCMYADNTWVVRYPVRDFILNDYSPSLIEQVSEVSLNDQLATLAFVSSSFCGGYDGNAVSFTAHIDSNLSAVEEMEAVIEKWLDKTKGVTVFPANSRPQAPYETITEVEYLSAVLDRVQFTGNSNDGECANGACPVR